MSEQDREEIKSEALHMADYRAWKDELLKVAILQFEYKEEDIKPKIEDDEYIREETSYTLGKYAKELYVACDGQEGLELYKKCKPDIVRLRYSST